MGFNLLALLSAPSPSNGCVCLSHWTLLLTGGIPLPAHPCRQDSNKTLCHNSLLEVTGEDSGPEHGLQLHIHTDHETEAHSLAAAARVIPIMPFNSESYNMSDIEEIVKGEARLLADQTRTCQDWVLRMVDALMDKGYMSREQHQTAALFKHHVGGPG